MHSSNCDVCVCVCVCVCDVCGCSMNVTQALLTQHAVTHPRLFLPPSSVEVYLSSVSSCETPALHNLSVLLSFPVRINNTASPVFSSLHTSSGVKSPTNGVLHLKLRLK